MKARELFPCISVLSKFNLRFGPQETVLKKEIVYADHLYVIDHRARAFVLLPSSSLVCPNF